MSLLLLFSASGTGTGTGPYVVSGRATPDLRNDGLPWTRMVLEEGPDPAGPWTEIDAFTFTPVDPDPSDPTPRAFTTDNATLASGWYRATFFDAAGRQEPTRPEFGGTPVRPTLGDIGALLHSRTTVDGGGEIGTFNAQTDPTGDQVQRLIDVAVGHIAIQLPDTLTGKQAAQAKTMVGYLAAILVEKSHFTDQVESGNSLVPLYESLLETGLAALLLSVEGNESGTPRYFNVKATTLTALAYPYPLP